MWMCECVWRNSYLGGGRYFGPRLQVKRLQAAAGRYGGGASAELQMRLFGSGAPISEVHIGAL